MKFTFETEYNHKALTVMAKALRRTVRNKKSKRSHIIGWLLVVLSVFLIFFTGEKGVFELRKLLNALVAAVLAVTLVFEDRMNGWFAAKRMLKGTEKATAVFDTENPVSFTSRTEAGISEFFYDRIKAVAETEEYFVFILSLNHAQIYDKSSLSEKPEDFRRFIAEKTGTEIITVK